MQQEIIKRTDMLDINGKCGEDGDVMVTCKDGFVWSKQQDINESVKDFHRYNKYGKTKINWTEIITWTVLGIVLGLLVGKMIIYVPNL